MELEQHILSLKNELEEIMKSKLKEIYPDFDEELLNKILYGYKRGYIVYPMDVFVIDDAVFHKETIYDDFGFIHEIKTFMFHGMEPYYDIFSEYFTLDEDDFIFKTIKGKFKAIADQVEECYKRKQPVLIGTVSIEKSELTARELVISGDISSAAYFIVAALIVPNSKIILKNVGLNPTRTGILDIAQKMGANIKILDEKERYRNKIEKRTIKILMNNSVLIGLYLLKFQFF